jgi:hypothetical protein
MPNRYEEDDIDVLGQMLWSVIRVAAVLTVLALAAWLWWGLA